MNDRSRAALRDEFQRVRDVLWCRETVVLCLSAILPAILYYHSRLGLVPPAFSKFEWFGLAFTMFFVIPAGVIVFGFRRRLSDYGLTLGRPGVWLRYLIPYAAVVLPVILVASRFDSFRSYYPQWEPASQGGWWLLSYEAGFAAYFFAWEFLFRGFVLFGLKKRFGPAAVVIQTVPFALAHLGKPEAEVFAAVIAGIALGIMSYRGRSVLPCALLHWVSAVVMDLGVIYG